MQIKLNWFDGTSSMMYGEFTEKDVDKLWEQMKREPKKRLYRFGTRLDLVKNAEVYNEKIQN